MARRATTGWWVLAGGLLFAAVGLRADEGDEEPPPAAARPLWQEPDRCEACHVESDWGKILEPDEAEFDHAETGFPLRGAHDDVACDDCHRYGLEALTTACDACHHDPHGALRTLGCERCHTERSWEVPRDFAFHEMTRFPLTGAHASVTCEACHRQRRGEVAATITTQCVSCHAKDYQQALPNHQAAGFDERCGNCHETSGFRGADHQHGRYALVGAHTTPTCWACHTGDVFAGLAELGGQAGQDCIVCHATDFASTTALSQATGGGVPDHGAFPTTCAIAGCHPDSESSGTWDTDGMPGQ